ncbi:hypothetical protein [Fulvitalea axinellae]
MRRLLEDIKKREFTTGANFSYNLDREFELISSNLNLIHRKYLDADFTHFLDKGRVAVLNTFSGGILFLKAPEAIEKVTIDSRSQSKHFHVSVLFMSESRRPENIKYKPGAGKDETVQWSVESIFPNFFEYPREIQKAMLLILGRIVKRICEYGRTNFAYMKIENEFDIELLIDGQVVSEVQVELN